MAIYSIQVPDGRTIDIEGPEGATDEQVIAAAQDWWNTEGQKSAQPAEPGVLDTITGGVQELGRQVGLTGRAVAEGISEVGGLVYDPLAALANMVLPEGSKLLTARAATEQGLTGLGVPQPQGELEEVVQAGGRGATGALVTAGASELASLAAKSPEIAAALRALASGLWQQTVAGGTGAAASETVRQEGGGLAAQLGAGVVGGMAGAKIAGLKAVKPGAPPSVIQAAERENIPVMTSDVIAKGRKFVQTGGEAIPLAGTAGARTQQQAARVNAISRILDDYGVTGTDNLPQKVFADLEAKRGGDLKRYSTLKTEVIDRLDQTGLVVPVTKANAEIDRQVAALRSLKSDSANAAADAFESFKNSIDNQGLGNIEKLRRQLGEDFKSPNLVQARNQAQKGISKVYGALREDMGDFIKANGERRDLTKWEVANRRLSTLADDVDQTILKSVLNAGEDAPEAINRMLFTDKRSQVEKLYQQLTPAGRANARRAILARAAEKAGDQVSAEKFANEMQKLGPSVNTFFKGGELTRVKDLVDVLNTTRRAAQSGQDAATGQRVVPYAIGSFLTQVFGGIGGAALGAAGAGSLFRIYESKPVRDMLLRWPKVKGTPEELALAKRIISALSVNSEEPSK